jgi:hypothetical protein
MNGVEIFNTNVLKRYSIYKFCIICSLISSKKLNKIHKSDFNDLICLHYYCVLEPL